MKRLTLALLCAVQLSIFNFQFSIAQAQYSLADWKGLNADTVLNLNVSEYKLDYNHPLPYADMQKEWTVKAELKCGTLGTEQVFVCKEGKASHLIGKNSLNGDISLGYDNTAGRFFVEVLDKNENAHRLWAGPKVEVNRWYEVTAKARYDAKKKVSLLELTVDGKSERLSYPGKALRHNASLWVIGHGFPGGYPNALQVRGGAIRHLEISGAPLPRVAGENPLFTDRFTADPAFTVVGNTVYAYVGEDQAGPGGWFNMPHWLCYSSTDMKHWTAHGPVLKSDDFAYAAPRSAWAAQMVAKDGKYYFYVTLDCKDKREHAIDVAVSDSPTGPFIPARKDGTPLITDGMTPDSHRRNADIDPTVLIDDDGTPWLAWGNGDCYMAKLKKNMIELDGEVKKVPLRNYSEGPWLFKRGKYYYCVYASDAPGVQPEQMAYSMAESIEGPWTYGGFVSTSANHGFTIHPSVIQFKGKWYYIYHDGSYNLDGAPGGDCRRSVCAEYMHFNADGTIQFVPLTQEGISGTDDVKAAVPAEHAMAGYLMVYHKDQDHGLHMAISRDGYTWTALNDDKPVIGGDTIAVQHGIRDPHIFRGPDGAFYLSMTDLHVFGQRDGKRTTEWERDGAKYGWGNNRGLVLMKSFDLIRWTRTNLDFSVLPDQDDMKWSEVGCVWAPETVFDEETGRLMIHFTTRQGKGMNTIYYAYVNNDYNALTSQPKLLAEAPNQAYNIIDSDIIKVGDTYHLFYVSHEYGATPKHATSQKITGPYAFDDLYKDGERRGHEAPNCWKRLGTNTYVVMYDNYHIRPMNFGFVETRDFFTYHPIGYFDAENSPMKRTNFSEQKHGAVTYVTEKEMQQLEKYWK